MKLKLYKTKKIAIQAKTLHTTIQCVTRPNEVKQKVKRSYHRGNWSDQCVKDNAAQPHHDRRHRNHDWNCVSRRYATLTWGNAQDAHKRLCVSICAGVGGGGFDWGAMVEMMAITASPRLGNAWPRRPYESEQHLRITLFHRPLKRGVWLGAQVQELQRLFQYTCKANVLANAWRMLC